MPGVRYPLSDISDVKRVQRLQRTWNSLGWMD